MFQDGLINGEAEMMQPDGAPPTAIAVMRGHHRALQVCERAAKKAINAILTECLRHLLTRSSENVLITLWECETALGKLIHEQNMLEAVDYYAEINDTIERMLDRLVRLEAEGRVKFTMVEAVGDAAD